MSRKMGGGVKHRINELTVELSGKGAPHVVRAAVGRLVLKASPAAAKVVEPQVDHGVVGGQDIYDAVWERAGLWAQT